MTKVIQIKYQKNIRSIYKNGIIKFAFSYGYFLGRYFFSSIILLFVSSCLGNSLYIMTSSDSSMR